MLKERKFRRRYR